MMWLDLLMQNVFGMMRRLLTPWRGTCVICDPLRAACCCCSCCCCSCCDWVGVGIVGLASSASWLFAGVREVMEPRWECIREWQESTANAQCKFVGESGVG